MFLVMKYQLHRSSRRPVSQDNFLRYRAARLYVILTLRGLENSEKYLMILSWLTLIMILATFQ